MLTAIAATTCADCLVEVPENGQCRHCRPNGRSKIPPLPPWPTHYLPGTAEKVALMKWRDDQGYQVHHPLDATEDERPNLSGVRGPAFQVREPRVGRLPAMQHC
jgi:hypothetical protein